MTEWELKLRQEICDEYCPDNECAYCSHRKKEEKCMYNKDIRSLIKSEICEYDNALFNQVTLVNGEGWGERSIRILKERGIK